MSTDKYAVSCALIIVCIGITIFKVTAHQEAWAIDDDGCRTPHRGVGTCILIRKCKPMLDLIQQSESLSQYAIDILRSYHCGFEGNEVKVCCPDGPITEGKPGIPTPPDVSSFILEQEACRTPHRGVGTCILIRNCKPMLDVMQQSQSLTQNSIEILRSYQCGFEGNQVKVCCPDGPIVIGKPGIPTPPDVTSHRNLNLLPDDCGPLPWRDRIIGGTKTALFEFPWMALISYETATGPDFRCGGSIINNRYILTAAHCVTNLSNLKLLGIRLGEYNISSSPDCEEDEPGVVTCAPHVQDIAIERAIPHPKYNPVQLTDDIGLIRLASPINISVESVKPICLPTTSTLRNRNHTNTNLLVTGWGATEFGRKSQDLLKLEVPVVTEESCKKLQEKSPAKVTYKQMCAGGKNRRDSCSGDSGGPLQRLDIFNNDPRFVQFGIVSFGLQPCGQEGFPAVYTRIDYYMDWILDNMAP